MRRGNARRVPDIEALLREDRLERARTNIYSFTRHTYARYRGSWHHRAICRELNAFVEGRTRFLILMAPPRTGKSELVSRRLPAYILGRNPDEPIIAASYSDDLASRMNRDVQRIIESPEYRELFPDTSLPMKGTKPPGGGTWLRNSDEFEIVGRRGNYRSAGIGSGITGRGAGTAIIDDPIKDAAEAKSKAYRDRAWDWYTTTLRTRLEENGRILLTLTRWHEDDLAGRLLALAKADANADQWRVVSFPMLKEGPPSDFDPREDGEPLWPEKYPVEECGKIRASVGSRAWTSLFQQRPAPDEGESVKRSWFRYWKALPAKFDKVIQSWDFAVKGTSTSDYCVGQVWGRAGADKYLLFQVREKADFPGQIRLIEQVTARFPNAREKIVEDKANGPAVIASLQKKIPGLIPFDPGDRSKEARLEAVSPDIEAGNVYFPDPAVHPWVRELEDELATFPNAANDDQVDALSQALLRLGAGSYNLAALGKL